VRAPARLVSRTFGLEVSEIRQLKDWIERFGREHQLASELVFQLVFCGEELMTNILTHASRESAIGSIRVQLEVKNAEASLTVDDDGAPFDPTHEDLPRGYACPYRLWRLFSRGLLGELQLVVHTVAHAPCPCHSLSQLDNPSRCKYKGAGAAASVAKRLLGPERVNCLQKATEVSRPFFWHHHR
jgi:anti-sigma regulatory factor (Ser/Thr protein kinase)